MAGDRPPQPSESAAHHPSRRLRSAQHALDTRTATRVIGLARSDHIGRAAQAAENASGLLDVSDPVIEAKLARLHTPAPAAPLPRCPAAAPFVPVLADAAFKRLWTNKVASGASAGPSKNTGDLALPLLDNPDTLRALAIMVQRIRNGRVSNRTRRHILASVLVAPEKKDGEPRPITVCEALYKMAAFGALADVAAFAPTLLSWYQFAFQPGGSESAGLLLKAATEHHFAFDTDAKNAYGEVDRAVMLTTLYNTPQLAPIWRMVDWAYSSPSEVLLRGNRPLHQRPLVLQWCASRRPFRHAFILHRRQADHRQGD